MTIFTSLPAAGSTAIISGCRRYRYLLERKIGVQDRICLFIMLNPSTADAHDDDPTIRRCKGFARSFAAGKLVVVNLFAFRTTAPKVLLQAHEPVGPENDARIRSAAEEAHQSGGIVIAAWGAHGKHKDRDREVLTLLRDQSITPWALDETAAGLPRHPLYLKGDCKPMPYRGRL